MPAITVGQLKKWLIECNLSDNATVTTSDGGDFINVQENGSGCSIFVRVHEEK
jgi:hypothetical protein